jgi:protein-S-isoprenylcysteine O-methyltransferase Ste14
MSELVFRALLALSFLALISLWCWAFWKGGFEPRSFFNRREGVLAGLSIRVLLAASISGICAYVASPASMSWSRIPLPRPARFSGIGSCVLALIVFGSAQAALGRGFSPSLRVKPGQALVINGPYRAVRHPMYLAFLLSWIGYWQLSANWFIGLTGIAAQFVIMLFRTPREEEMLAEAFGDDYTDYARRTPMFLPRWKDLRFLIRR